MPAYNEQERLGATLVALADHLRRLDLDASLRVIDNGSSDATTEIVDQVNRDRRTPELTVSGCSDRGKGNAVARGILTSPARWVGFCDADLATEPSAISPAVAYLREGWPVVIGSRRCPGASRLTEQPLMRRAGSLAFRVATRSVAGDLYDTQCGFKFFDGTAARRIFSGIRTTGFAFDVEVIARARALGFPIKEFPVTWDDQDRSTFRPVQDGMAAARDVWRLRRTLHQSARAEV